ncbi:MAG TPA: hypothetical protein PLX89_11700 [Verrucomicrobiota bacterium]|nr:hypothetical protein [Verrucomicrobiales bacterium]HRI13655.1 hypothetical protein [Verrucomicrobiota bacterium]
MKPLSLTRRCVLAVECALLVLFSFPAQAHGGPPALVTPLRANGGVSAVLAPTSDPAVFKATVVGVVQSGALSPCLDNAELEARFPSKPEQPVVINGTATLTPLDGAGSLELIVSGTALPDPANPGIYHAQYQVTFAGGTGTYASARGQGEINEVVMFTSPTTATATWTMKRLVLTPRP